MKTISLFCRYVVILGFAMGSLAMAGEPLRLPGMGEEIEIKSAKELAIKASTGDYVAVLDQSQVLKIPNASPSQDHHNGSLALSEGNPNGDTITIRGKYYIPGSIKTPPANLRLNIRKRTRAGWEGIGGKMLPVGDAKRNQWISFEIEIPVPSSGNDGQGSRSLTLSALPFAGPVYIDDLQVMDVSGNQLWRYPEFEPDDVR